MTYWPSVSPGAAWPDGDGALGLSHRLRGGRAAGFLTSSRIISADISIGPLGFHLFGLDCVEFRNPGADH